jgi:hypothetical protein
MRRGSESEPRWNRLNARVSLTDPETHTPRTAILDPPKPFCYSTPIH